MTGKSRWAESETDVEARRKEKEAKKAAKLEKVRKQQESAAQTHPNKRQKLSPAPLISYHAKTWSPARGIDNFEPLNHIEEGSYGSVSRARNKATGEIVALKKLKIDSYSSEGIPVPALREISILQSTSHANILELQEVVLGPQPTDIYLVLPFLPHDLKAIQAAMTQPFTLSEVKTLMLQITSALAYLHDHWILHRDLKTSNILLANDGTVRLADFGMARQYSDPLPPNLTQCVVTLWYRAPELLLGTSTYGPAIDIWSLGCVFGELLKNEPILSGKTEADQLNKIFTLIGVPNSDVWPGWRRLPNAKGLKLKDRQPDLPSRFSSLSSTGIDLIASLLSMNPDARPVADQVLDHQFFSEAPRPKPTSMFPTFPSKANGERPRPRTPEAPRRGMAPKIDLQELKGSKT